MDEKVENPIENIEDQEVKLTAKDVEIMAKRAAALKGCRKKRGFPPKSGTKVSLPQAIKMLKDCKGLEHKAAKQLGVSFQCWKNYKKKWPELQELATEYDELRTEKVMTAGYIEAVKNKNDRMMRFWLDRKGAAFGFEKQFKDDKPPQIQVNIGQQITFQLTDDVKTRLVDQIKRKRMDEQDRIKMDNALDEIKLLEQKKEEMPKS